MSFAIRRLTIKRYRAIQYLEWNPGPKLNMLVGSADSGKSTILSAIALLFAQSVPGPRSEFDYHERNVTEGFLVEAVVGNIDFAAIADEGRQLPLFGLAPDGKVHDLPEAGLEPVLLVRASGTADLEVVHEMATPNGESIAFGVGLRRRIGVLRITDDSSSARALRITPGSLLGRQFDLSDLRGSVREALAELENSLPLSDATIEVVDSFEESFRSDGLPDDVDLGLVTPQGSDLISMVELVQGENAKTAIPIALSGSGTRSLMTLNVLARAAPKQSVVLFEEPERGLEPFGQRIAAGRLIEISKCGQSFITTHSPIMLEEIAGSSVWRIERGKQPISLNGMTELFKTDAEAIFSPLAIICEGSTECGFLSVMLPHLTGRSVHALGVHLVDGKGQPHCLDLAEKLANAGMRIAMFVDNEEAHTGRRARIAAKTTCFVWEGVTNIEEAIARYASYDDLPRLMEAARMDLQYALCQVRDALPPRNPPTAVSWNAITASDPEQVVRTAMYEMSNRHDWFKTFDYGAALACALIEVGIPEQIQTQLTIVARRISER